METRLKSFAATIVCAVLLCLSASPVLAAEPGSAKYELNQSVTVQGQCDFSVLFYTYIASNGSYPCFKMTGEDGVWYIAVLDSSYSYYKSAFEGKSINITGLYLGDAEDGIPIINAYYLIEGETATLLENYLWELNSGTAENPNFISYCDMHGRYYFSTSEDGSYLQIDTNPANSLGDEIAGEMLGILSYIKGMNKFLGLPDWLYEEMISTSAIDGKQKEVFDCVTVTWTYHPDRGLEVMYRKNA